MTRVIISGAIANKAHNGGATWTRLNWALGFRRLGCDVVFLEQLPPHLTGSELAVRYFRDVMRQFDLDGQAGLIGAGGRTLWGLSEGRLRQLGASADLLINITGHLTWEPIVDTCHCKAYIDLDPGYTQFWHADGTASSTLAGHDYFFTVGQNIGTAACPIPTGGRWWRPVRQPVVLDQWPAVRPAAPPKPFTTIASWRGTYGPVEFSGRTYGLKVHEFRKFAAIPRCVKHTFELALDIHPTETADLHMLAENGWRIVDPMRQAGDPTAFRAYVQNSGAEFSVAQGIYVETNSGWFSDRTVRYLASGRPALVQDTGFSHHLPTGEGLIAFTTVDEAVAGAEAILADYNRHCRAAREIAHHYFDSDKVLRGLLRTVGLQNH